jgi:hypothetical protein
MDPLNATVMVVLARLLYCTAVVLKDPQALEDAYHHWCRIERRRQNNLKPQEQEKRTPSCTGLPIYVPKSVYFWFFVCYALIIILLDAMFLRK